MTGSNPTVLVVGAAGRIAGLVVPELARRGAVVRGLVRSEEQAATARKNGAAEVVHGDFGLPRKFRTADFASFYAASCRFRCSLRTSWGVR
jgi:uncharacterized protein YbjT (DUF2867 family)